MFTKNRLPLILGSAVTLAASIGALPSAAAPRPVVVTAPRVDDALTRRVSFADLNLASAADAKVLDRRVAAAVNVVCLESVGPAAEFYTEMSCRKVAWRGARPQLARAIERAYQIASRGSSAIPMVAIAITAPLSR